MRLKILIFLCLRLSSEIGGKKLRIIGGSDAVIREYPFIVSMRNISNNHFFCAGSIIGPSHILTSSHCLDPFKNDYTNLRIYTGVTSIRNIEGPSFKIDFAILHPEFKMTVTCPLKNRFDIAVIKLTQSIQFNDLQMPIELPSENIFTGNLAVVLGWGHSCYPNGRISDKLRKAPMILFHANDCTSKVPTVVYEDQLCAFNSAGVGTCIGDSGGPVIKNGKLAGIISLSFGCGLGIPDIHANVYMFKMFIKAAMSY